MAEVIQDFGAKIGGARKDFFGQKYSRSEFLALTKGEQTQLATIDKVWTRPNWGRMVAKEGMEPEVAWIVSYIRALMPKSPQQIYMTIRDDSDVPLSAIYAEGVMAVRDCLMGVRTLQDLRSSAERLRDDLRDSRAVEIVTAQLSLTSREMGARPKYSGFPRDLTPHNALGYLDRRFSSSSQARKSAGLISLATWHSGVCGWPEVKGVWAASAYEQIGSPAWDTEQNLWYVKGTVVWCRIINHYRAENRLEELKGVLSDEIVVWAKGEDAWLWDQSKCRKLAEELAKHPGVDTNFVRAVLPAFAPERKQSKSTGAIGEIADNFARSGYLGHCQREGLPDYRAGRDVKEEDFAATFGFRAGEFGNWVNQSERQASLNHAYDALRDLADVLGIDTQGISLGGTLAIAFGSRGRGSYAAHYEINRKVVNLTKPSGAGALAHEWFHALDHYIGEAMGRDDLWSRINGGQLDRLRGRVTGKPFDSLSAGARPPALDPGSLYPKEDESPLKLLVAGVTDLWINGDQRMQTVPEVERSVNEYNDRKLREWSQWCDAMFRSATKVVGEPGVAPLLVMREDPLLLDVSPEVREAAKSSWVRIDKVMRSLRRSDKSNSSAANWTLNVRNFEKACEYYGHAMDRMKKFSKMDLREQAFSGVSTDYAKCAVSKDAKRSPKYWSTHCEMLARTFEAVIGAKLDQNGQRCDYLVRPDMHAPAYPVGEDLQVLSNSFDRGLRQALPMILGARKQDRAISLVEPERAKAMMTPADEPAPAVIVFGVRPSML